MADNFLNHVYKRKEYKSRVLFRLHCHDIFLAWYQFVHLSDDHFKAVYFSLSYLYSSISYAYCLCICYWLYLLFLISIPCLFVSLLLSVITLYCTYLSLILLFEYFLYTHISGRITNFIFPSPLRLSPFLGIPYTVHVHLHSLFLYSFSFPRTFPSPSPSLSSLFFSHPSPLVPYFLLSFFHLAPRPPRPLPSPSASQSFGFSFPVSFLSLSLYSSLLPLTLFAHFLFPASRDEGLFRAPRT